MRGTLNAQRQVGGIFSLIDSRETTGNVFYVNSSTGSDVAGNGQNPDAPFATINYAVTQCTDNNGDLIIVMPGHTETIIAAGGITVDKIGVKIVGIGRGRNRPVINYTTSAAGTFLVSAANAWIENVVFKPLGVASVVTAVSVTAADATFNLCEFELANGTNQAVAGITTTAAADRLTVQNCKFHGSNNAGTNAALVIVGGDSHFIFNNVFQGAYGQTVGAISQITTTTTNCIIQFNYIQNFTAGATKAITMTASSTGQISDNNMQILSGTAPITGAAMSWVGCNYYAATIATAGTLI